MSEGGRGPQPSLAFAVSALLEEQRSSGEAYLEFLRRDSLSVGLYVLPAHGTDPQSPHTEDEIYVVLDGTATLRTGEEDYPVAAGSVVFVGAGVEHRFEAIESDLRVLVFFAPAEGTGARQ